MITNPERRRFLAKSLPLASGVFLGASLSCRPRVPDGLVGLDMQLGWLAGGNQLGEIVAKRLGYMEQEGIYLQVHPGGPNIDGVALIASGRYQLGQVSSSPSLMLAVSQGIPIQCIGVCVQQHPYSYFSLPDNPVLRPQDLAGKKVGTNATGQILLDAVLKRHGMSRADLDELVIVGSSLTPLLTGQVEVISGWTTNVTALKPLGPDRLAMRLWDQGIRLYAMPFYATADTITNHADLLEGFLRAAGRGWQYAYENIEGAVRLLIEEYPILRYEDELAAAHELLGYVFTEETERNGWATMNRETWAEQIRVHEELGQFTNRVPSVDDVMTESILEATSADRPHLNSGPYGPRSS